MEEIIGYICATIVGISLGLIGSGGSILAVPILVYLFRVSPTVATGYSLFIVGATALIGGVQHAWRRNVNFPIAIVFGIPSLFAIFFNRYYVIPYLPHEIATIGGFILTKDVLIMTLFAILMVIVSTTMIRQSADSTISDSHTISYPSIALFGILEGSISGFVGVGGGFLIIPALVFLARLPMKQAVGTSLFIIATKSLLGFFIESRQNIDINYHLIVSFTLCSMIGMVIGTYLSNYIDGSKLKKFFGWFVLFMGIYIIGKELWFK